MAYERLDIEVTDNGSSRRVQRNLEDLGRTGRQSATEISQEMARMAVSSRNSAQAFSGTLQDLQRQFGATSRAALLSSSAMATVMQSALNAARPVSALTGMLTLYTAASTTSGRASLLSSSAMGTVATSAIAAARPVALLTLTMNANAAAAVRMTQANLLASTAMRTVAGAQVQAALPARPQQLLLPNYSAGAGAGAAAATASANGYASVLQRIQGLAGSTRTALGGLWTSVRSGASSAADAVRNMFANFGGGGAGGGGGGAAAAAGGAARGIDGITAAARNASSALITMNTLMYSLQLGLLAVAAIRWADEWQNIQNKLDLVTRSTQELSDVNDVLYATAQRTRTGYSEIVELFQSLRLQAAGLGLSMKATAEMTETVAMASQIGSLGPQQAQAGILQLTQALALGRLSGQNLNAVLQATPRIAIAIAEGLGKAPPELRRLAEEGKLTADQVIAALQNQAPKIAEEFLRLKPSIGSAFTVLNNGFIDFMGKLEEATGFASGFSSFIIGLSNNMDILAVAIVAVGAALLVAFGGAVQRAIIATSLAIAANPIGAFAALVIATVAAVTILKDRFEEYPELLAGLAGGVAILATLLIGPLVTSLWAAVTATWAWTVALLANPFTWIALAIGAVVAAIVYFGNKTYEVNGKTISGWNYLKAAAAGTWAAIVAGARALWENLANIFTHIAQGLGSLGMAFLAVMRGDFASAASWGKMAWSAGEAAVGDFANVGRAMAGAYTSAFNASVAAAPAAVPGGGGSGSAPISLDDTPGTRIPYTQPGSGSGSGSDSDPTGRGSRRLTRAEMIQAELQRIHDETVTAANLTYTYLDRKAYEELDRFNAGLRSRKDADGNPFAVLNPQEEQAMLQAILGLDKAKRLQEARDSILEDAIGPRLKYIETEEAIGQLLQQNQISADEAARAYLDASIAFYQTREDAVSGQMLGRLQILKEMRDEAGPVADAMKSIWDEQVGPMRTYAAQLQAIAALERDRFINAQQAADATRNATITYLDAQTDAASGVTRALMKIQREAADVASQMEAIFSNLFSNMEDMWVSLTKGEKVDVKGLFEGLQEDVARATFKQYIGGPLAAFAQNKLGIELPGLKGPVGESRDNPMWVRSADALPGADSVAGGQQDPISSVLRMLGLGGNSGGVPGADPTGGLIDDMTGCFGDFTDDLGGTLDTGAQQFGTELSAGIGALGNILGGLIGGEAGDIVGTLMQGASLILGGFGVGGFATGGSFTVGQHYGSFASGGSFMVGGGGGVDSQLVQFRASPGERVNIERAGQVQDGGGGTSIMFSIDARGADANVEAKIERALAEAAPRIVTAARQGAAQDRQYEMRRMPVGAKRN